MKKTIKFGGRELEFEANLGTSKLFQKLTGKNLFGELSALKDIRTDDPEIVAKAGGVLELYTQLAYVMNVQAENAKDIKTMMAKMNEEDYLEWSFGFDLAALTIEATKEIASLWQTTQKTTSMPKN